jgi:alpha-beta hydrolase superfamily lysophospholipase
MRAGRLRKIGTALLITTGAFAAAVVGTTLVMSWHLVRPSRRPRYDSVPLFRFGKLEPISLVTSDNIRLHAWILLSRRARPDDWIVLLHGYNSNRIASLNRARFFSRRGFNVLLLHFRGHGASEPTRISYGFHERKDVRAAFEFILSARPSAQIGLDGISMGAAAAAYAVAHHEVEPAWMILESCYDNIHHALSNRLAMRVGERLAPWIAWPVEQVVEWLAELRSDDLDPAKALENAACPILVMAGDSERVLRTVEIEYLYGSIHSPKELALFAGATHEDLLAYNPRRYARAVGQFLRKHCGFRHAPSATGLATGQDKPETIKPELSAALLKVADAVHENETAS